MPVPVSEWRNILGSVTGHLVAGEMRVATHELVSLVGAANRVDTWNRCSHERPWLERTKGYAHKRRHPSERILPPCLERIRRTGAHRPPARAGCPRSCRDCRSLRPGGERQA